MKRKIDYKVNRESITLSNYWNARLNPRKISTVYFYRSKRNTKRKWNIVFCCFIRIDWYSQWLENFIYLLHLDW